MNSNQHEERETYKVLLIEQNKSRMLVKRDGQETITPTVEISFFAGPAEQITSILQSLWGVFAVVIDFVIDEADSSRYAILEVAHVSPPAGLCELIWMPVLEFCPSHISPEVWVALSQMLAGDGRHNGPFSRFGWLRDAQEWLSQSLGRQVPAASDVRQLNASSTFALIRLGFSSGPAYWL